MAYIGKEPAVGNFQVCDAISVVNGKRFTQCKYINKCSLESANHMLVSLPIYKNLTLFTIFVTNYFYI